MTATKRAARAKLVSASFISLGCFKNLVDTEVLGGFLKKRGVQVVSSYEAADWVVVNTCGFIRDAKEESIDEILAVLDKKEKGEIKHVAVFGCLVQRYQAELQKAFPKADILWGVNDIEELAELIAGNRPAAYGNRQLFLYSHRHGRILTTTPNSTFIKISEGCDMGCSFCAIPRIRGPFRSRPLSSVITEAERYRGMGFSEVNLVSQNSSHYGIDLGKGPLLPELLRQISRLGFSWVRQLYLMPEETNALLLEAFCHPTVVPYFDLPFQHVAPAVLRRMNRGGSYAGNLNLVRSIRGMVPQAVLRSSFIAGFPGEREEDFRSLLRFVEEARIEYVGVFAYSDEEDTPAFRLPGKINPGIVEERTARLQDAADRNLASFFGGLVDSVQEFIPLGPWTGQSTIGRIRAQAPEVDGLTRVAEKFAGGGYDIFPIRITGFEQEVLAGKRIIPGQGRSVASSRRKV